MTIVFLALVAFFTSVVSAISGMGGGILLFSTMTFFLKLDVIIPIHGVVQFTSNGSRVFYLIKNVKLNMFLPYIFGALIGTTYAVYLKQHYTISTTIPLSIVIILILYTVFKPKKMPQIKLPDWAFFIVGILNGLMAIFVGAVGPFLAVFFVRDDLSKEQVIANKASMQLFIHLLKFPAFFALGFSYFEYWSIWLPMIVVSVFGTKYGISVLKKIDDKIFILIFKSALVIAALRLTYKIITS